MADESPATTEAELRSALADALARVTALEDELEAARAQQLPPMRQKAITLPEITDPVAAHPSQAVTTPPVPAYAAFVSISPLEAQVSKASIHAVSSAVPAARKENRWLTLGLYFLAVLYGAIQLARGH